MSGGGQQEVVMLFNSEGSVSDEMLFSTFEDLLAGKQTLDAYAASSTKAAFCLVGNGLSLRGVVYFLLNIDEEGTVDPTFNLPLHYLVKHAGVAEDLGRGGIRKASRAQCPVPWQAVNLWEPGENHGLKCLQSQIFRNKLKLKTSTGCVDEDVAGSANEIELVEDTSSSDFEFTFDDQQLDPTSPRDPTVTDDAAEAEIEPDREVADKTSNGSGSPHRFEAEPLPDLEDELFERPRPMPKPAPHPAPEPETRPAPEQEFGSESPAEPGREPRIEPLDPIEPVNPIEKPENGSAYKPELRSEIKPVPMPVAKNVELGAKLTEVFGEAGKVSMPDLIRLHTEQLNQVKAKHREDLEHQQLGYLDQLRACREEIHSLKVSLRQEQGRNRRLEQMLRS